MIKLLIFDLDGTLVESAEDIRSAMNLLLASEGLSELSLDEIKLHIGEGLRKLLSKLIPDFKPGSPRFSLLEERFLQFYAEECTRHLRWMPGALELLKTSSLSKALVTNKNWEPCLRVFEKLEFPLANFKFAAGLDSYSHFKPHPGPLIEALRKSGANPRECLMIGDGLPDLRAANALGCFSVACRFGYTAENILARARPDFWIDSLSELPELIAGLN